MPFRYSNLKPICPLSSTRRTGSVFASSCRQWPLQPSRQGRTPSWLKYTMLQSKPRAMVSKRCSQLILRISWLGFEVLPSPSGVNSEGGGETIIDRRFICPAGANRLRRRTEFQRRFGTGYDGLQSRQVCRSREASRRRRKGGRKKAGDPKPAWGDFHQTKTIRRSRSTV